MRFFGEFSCVTSLLYLFSAGVLSLATLTKPSLNERASEHLKARVLGDDRYLSLAQYNLTGTSLVKCTQHPTWFRSWTDHMEAQYYAKACIASWEKMMEVEISKHGSEHVEFLAEGAEPVTEYQSIRTPRRYSTGKSQMNIPG